MTDAVQSTAGGGTAAAVARGWVVRRSDDGTVSGSVEPLAESGGTTWFPADEPADGPAEVCLEVEAAGFNYKDALACAGHPGVARRLPLVPGIDAAGVLRTATADIPAGTPVVITGNGLGETRPGGFATHLRADAAAVIRRPASLSAEAAMAMGTAGLTAVLAVDRLAAVLRGPAAAPAAEDADWLVTGASGGVGMLVVAASAAAGHRVVACTRKPAVAERLRALGAAAVITPGDAVAVGTKPLASGRYHAVIDTVGGSLLANLLRVVQPGGAVASIGNAGGNDLVTTVLPFILRGVTLTGIDAAGLATNDDRRRLWPRLAGLWPLVRDHLPIQRVPLADAGDWARQMLAGQTAGRGVVVPALERPAE